jgi:hypothetical protein
MFSYVYANGTDGQRGLTYYVAAETEAGINKLALEFISGMIGDYRTQDANPPLKPAIDAVEAKDIKAAIEAWNEFATTELQQTIARHHIEPIELIE